MRKSKNEEVQNFLDGIMMIDSVKFNSLIEMREIVFNVFPDTNECIKYGGIIFSLNSEDFCGLFVSQKHVSFEFSTGYLMKDPDKLLEGGGKFRRHLKIRTKEDVKNKNVIFFVKQAT